MIVFQQHWWRRFWFDFEISALKLRLVRVALFSVLAVDAWLQIAHAPRYGAGGFNVSHFPWLDAVLPMPTRSGLLIIWILQAFLAARIVLGVAVGTSLKLLTVLYGYAYFISQLDSYQHHYLVFLILLLGCFVPWDEAALPKENEKNEEREVPDRSSISKVRSEPKKNKRRKNKRAAERAAAAAARAERERVALEAAERARALRGKRVKSWALRLLLVQLSLMYLWAAVTKTAPLWLDGTALDKQISNGWMRDLIGSLGGFGTAAHLVLLTELFLAVALLVRALWPAALVVGVGMHVAFHLSGLQIGLFSYFMVAIYLLILPDWLMDLVERQARKHLAPMWNAIGRTRAALGRVPWAVSVALVLGSSALLLALPFSEALFVAAVCALLGSIAASTSAGRSAGSRPGLGHAIACAALLLLNASTDQAHDYYKYWGGSSRRLNDEAGMKAAYSRLVTLSPWYGPGHYYYGRVLQKEGKVDQALAAYQRARDRSPGYWRAYLAEALIHHQAGRGAQALEAARKVLELQPDNRQAQAIQRTWAAKQGSAEN